MAFEARIVPFITDPEPVRVGRERWSESVVALKDEGTEALAGLIDDANFGELMDGIFCHSPFLTREMLKELVFTGTLSELGPDAALQLVWEGIDALDPYGKQADIMKELRVAKRRASLVIALADIAGLWDLVQVTNAISELAERTLAVAWRHALIEAVQRKKLPIELAEDPLEGSGLICLAMGKLGAGELNYSSDIDLIVLFDDALPVYEGHLELRNAFTGVTRTMIKLMEERTSDGYVFRTDLRLRPDPSSTPPAVSVTAAEAYYTSMGQNWERAAMIKARPIACDQEAAKLFLDQLRSFIWRRNLDFAMIEDIHSIKRQIAAQRKGTKIKAEGQNVKLGRGGIREIEFFAQTQQLIWGGRDPGLRVKGTEEALAALVAAGRLRGELANAFKLAYRFLRKVEHRLQMVDDKQTQILPESAEELDRFAAFLGYEDPKIFRGDLAHNLHTVAHQYAELFEEAPQLTVPAAESGSLVFTGTDDDPETIETLAKLGFSEPSALAATVRDWHRGRYRATRSERARQLLTELTPSLLEALGRMPEPDQAFRRFDRFLEALPAGVQIFSLFHANPGLVEVMAEILGMAPSLARQLGRQPSLFEGILTHDVMQPLPGVEALTEELEHGLEQAEDYESALDITRRWTSDRRFQIGIQILRGRMDADAAGVTYSNVADAAIRALLPIAETEFAQRHGHLPEVERPHMAVLAYGKHGGQSLTHGSDLDLVFVYDAPLNIESNGDKPLYTSAYMIRLGQRLISALSAKTAEGALYEVDMRLRPNGNKGPVAVSLEAFEKYYREDAWAFEFMALTRARIVTSSEAFRAKMEPLIHDLVAMQRDPKDLTEAIASMRERTEQGHKSTSPWEIKHWRGGLLDLEFIAQYIQLRDAADHPEICDRDTARVFEKLGAAGMLEQEEAESLASATRTLRSLQGILRLTVGDSFDPETAPDALKARLSKVGGVKDFSALEVRLENLGEMVNRAFERHLSSN